MPSIVDAERLSKTFQVKVRDPGLRGAVRALFRPRYRDVLAVRDVTFRIEPGEIIAFLGPNGAGKTTTLKMLAGLLYPTSGRVEAAGFVPWTGGPPFKRRIALVLGNRQQLVWDLPPEETRSEERRVGKEGRSRWLAERYKKMMCKKGLDIVTCQVICT